MWTGALLLEVSNLSVGFQLKGTQSVSHRIAVAVTYVPFPHPLTCCISGHTHFEGYVSWISKQGSPPLSRMGKKCFSGFHQCCPPFLFSLLTVFLGKEDGISWRRVEKRREA